VEKIRFSRFALGLRFPQKLSSLTVRSNMETYELKTVTLLDTNAVVVVIACRPRVSRAYWIISNISGYAILSSRNYIFLNLKFCGPVIRMEALRMTVNEKLLFDSLKQLLALVGDITNAADASAYIGANKDYINMAKSDANDALAALDSSFASTCEGDSCKFSF
jgi:hypothetical protein